MNRPTCSHGIAFPLPCGRCSPERIQILDRQPHEATLFVDGHPARRLYRHAPTQATRVQAQEELGDARYGTRQLKADLYVLRDDAIDFFFETNNPLAPRPRRASIELELERMLAQQYGDEDVPGSQDPMDDDLHCDHADGLCRKTVGKACDDARPKTYPAFNSKGKRVNVTVHEKE